MDDGDERRVARGAAINPRQAETRKQHLLENRQQLKIT